MDLSCILSSSPQNLLGSKIRAGESFASSAPGSRQASDTLGLHSILLSRSQGLACETRVLSLFPTLPLARTSDPTWLVWKVPGPPRSTPACWGRGLSLTQHPKSVLEWEGGVSFQIGFES